MLADSGRKPRRPAAPEVEAERGLVVEAADGAFCGAVAGCEKLGVTLEDRHAGSASSRWARRRLDTPRLTRSGRG